MRIVKIGQFGAKLGAFENRKKLPKMIENRSFFVIFRDFQMHLTLSRTNRFFRFSLKLKLLSFTLIALFCGICVGHFNSLLLVNHH